MIKETFLKQVFKKHNNLCGILFFVLLLSVRRMNSITVIIVLLSWVEIASFNSSSLSSSDLYHSNTYG